MKTRARAQSNLDSPGGESYGLGGARQQLQKGSGGSSPGGAWLVYDGETGRLKDPDDFRAGDILVERRCAP